jgi:purine-binding chemotaxis protein CheW
MPRKKKAAPLEQHAEWLETAVTPAVLDRADVSAVTETPVQLVTFMLGEEEYGLPIMQVQEILRLRELNVTKVPNAPQFVDGVINLRGRLVPIIDVRKRFGLAAIERDRANRICVVRVAGRTVGMMLDAVVEVVVILPSAIEPLPDLATSIDAVFIVGVVRVEDRLVIVLEIDRMFTPEEQTQIAGMPDEGTGTGDQSDER